MTYERAQALAAFQVPQSQRFIDWTRERAPSFKSEPQRTDRSRML